MRRPLLISVLAAAACGALAAPAQAARLAFVAERDGNQEIYVMEADGSAQRNLTAHPDADRAPAWSPDGTRIAFVRGLGAEADVWVMGADGSSPARLTSAAGADVSPAWSPDGRSLAFVSDRAGGPEVHVMDAAGGPAQRLTSSEATAADPVWSPDGSRIAYGRDDAAQLHVVTLGGADAPVGGGAAAFDRDPAWSPDGARLAFATIRDQVSDSDVFTMTAGGDDQRPLVATTAREIDPAWSAEGPVAFATDRDGDLEIAVIDRAGGAVRALTTAPGDDSAPAWAPPPVSLAPPSPPGATPAPAGPSQPGAAPGLPAGTVRRNGVRIRLLRSRIVLGEGRLRLTLRYSVDRPARLTLAVRHRDRTLVRFDRRARKGTNTITWSRRIGSVAPWRGRYPVLAEGLAPISPTRP